MQLVFGSLPPRVYFISLVLVCVVVSGLCWECDRWWYPWCTAVPGAREIQRRAPGQHHSDPKQQGTAPQALDGQAGVPLQRRHQWVSGR